ncbi:MAG: AI-2E family transporter, partial [Chitinophagaceae bacterium]
MNQKLYKAATILAIIVLSTIIIVYAKPFLVPITFGGVFAMLLLPVSRFLQRKKVGKALATILSILLIATFFAVAVLFISWQASDIIDNAGKIEQELTKKVQSIKQVITEQFGVSRATQDRMIKEQQTTSSTKASTVVMGFLAGVRHSGRGGGAQSTI